MSKFVTAYGCKLGGVTSVSHNKEADLYRHGQGSGTAGPQPGLTTSHIRLAGADGVRLKFNRREVKTIDALENEGGGISDDDA